MSDAVGSIVKLVAGKIGELLLQEADILFNVKDQVGILQRELTWMVSFIKDMEAMDEEGCDERCRSKIKEIRKIAYDAEDLVESYILESSRSRDNKMEDMLRRYICFCSRVWGLHRMGREIEVIRKRIDETTERSNRYQGDSGGGRALNERLRQTEATYPHDYEDHVVGLEEDIRNMVVLLTSDEFQIQVLSIAGMGGSGKTTLARKLYNHQRIKSHFECLAWASISQQWNTRQIRMEILRKALGGHTMPSDAGVWSDQVVVDKLHECLMGKSYLIVLDDVWEKQAMQEILSALPLSPGINDGRKIVVTTRNREVTDFPDLKCHIHEPKRLTDEESWDLFRKIALKHRQDIPFKELAEEMLKKCDGLPLAVIALAGLLRKKDTLEEWEKVRKAVSSKIMDVGSGTHQYGRVDKMLELSYNDLPLQLKPCFLHLATFPEDCEIRTETLIRLWIGEGFITTDEVHDGDTLEDVGREYLDELVQRCMVQVASRNYEGKVKSIRIHDLMRVLCIRKAKEHEFLEVYPSQLQNFDARPTLSRRIIVHDYCSVFNVSTKDSPLRSLNFNSPSSPEKRFTQFYKDFKFLRVLQLINLNFSDPALSAEIGKLIHLRYLELRNTNILQLPSSIGNLQNLQTLYYGVVVLRYPTDTPQVPNVLWRIKGLQHLYLPFFPKGCKVHTLKHLQTLKQTATSGQLDPDTAPLPLPQLHKRILSLFSARVRGEGDWMVEELPRSNENLQELRVESIRNMKQVEAAFRCPSIKSDKLHVLDLEWSHNYISKAGPCSKTLEPIAHCKHLRKLKLDGRIQDRPASIVFPSSIIKLVLHRTGLEAKETLEALGKLPCLKFLRLLADCYVGAEWSVKAGEFSQLKELELRYLENLEHWSVERGAMSQLEKLEVVVCCKLRGPPEGLKFITTLKTLEFEGERMNPHS